MARRKRADRYRIEPLGRHHDRNSFACGVETLGRDLRTRALQDARRRIAAPFVLVEEGSNAIGGYYTLSATGVRLGRLPENVTRRLPAYPVVPATLLGRLAVDQSMRGQGVGEHLLMDALFRSWTISREVASFAVVVDAKDDDARAFYVRYDFIPFTENARRLFLPMKTVAVLFE